MRGERRKQRGVLGLQPSLPVSLVPGTSSTLPPSPAMMGPYTRRRRNRLRLLLFARSRHCE